MTRSMNGSIDRRTVTQCTIQLLVILLCSDCWPSTRGLGKEWDWDWGLGRCVGKWSAHNLRHGRLVAAFMVLWLTTQTTSSDGRAALSSGSIHLRRSLCCSCLSLSLWASAWTVACHKINDSF